jgi:hypothetical protein
VAPEGCSPEHERQRRCGAMEAKNGGGLSSSRGRSRALRSSGERGKGAVRAGDSGWGGNGGVNGFNAIEDEVRLRGG